MKLRNVYGKPLFSKGTGVVSMSRDMLDRAGQIILDSIKAEIRKDISKSAGLRGRGKPVPVPDSPAFVNSFSYKLVGRSTLSFSSTWPTAEAHVAPPGEAGRPSKPFPMRWLTRDQFRAVPIVTQEGKVILRTPPLPGGDVWMHPGFHRYTFIERGVRKGRVKVIEQMAPELFRLLLEAEGGTR